MNTFNTNYRRLKALGIYDEAAVGCRRSVSGGFMDLVVERLPHLDTTVTNHPGQVYSMAHYFEQNGDLCSDPEMTFIVYPELETAEALTFQQAIPPLYQEVYPSEGLANITYKRQLNTFLKTWLNALRQQGHGREWHE